MTKETKEGTVDLGKAGVLNDDKGEYFFTSDIALTSLLMTKGFSLKGCEEVQRVEYAPKRVTFYFDNTQEIKEMAHAFLMNSPDLLEFKKFFNYLREVKKMIYSFEVKNEA